ncbi:MAG: glycosyltransferase family 4 protein [Nitrospirae bacterium]|nr:glycosyltransferase family 4 protein [Nitrospirota bacterium]
MIADAVSGRKIAVIATIIDDKPTGLGTYASNVIQELSKLTKLSVITAYDSPFKDNPNIEIMRAPEIVQPKNKIIGALARFVWLNLFLPRILHAKRFDLLISLTQHGIFFSSVPQIITVHDLIPVRFPSQYRLQNLYYRFLLPHLIFKARAVNTISEFTKKEVVRYYGVAAEKVIVSGNGFNPLPISFSTGGKGEDYILMVGATFPHKNIHRVVEAYSQSALLQKYGLKIVGGKTNYLQSLKSLSEKLGVNGKVEFVDYADTVPLAELYGHALIFVYPSLYEGFGMPPLEAMQAGTPVAASDIDPIREACGNAVFYFDPNSATDIRKKLELLVEDEGLRNDLVTKGLERASRYTWRNVAKKIYDSIQDSIHLAGRDRVQ